MRNSNREFRPPSATQQTSVIPRSARSRSFWISSRDVVAETSVELYEGRFRVEGLAAEVVTQPTGTPIAFDGATPHSIALAVTTSSAATLDITWSVQVGGTSPVIEHRFRLDLSG